MAHSVEFLLDDPSDQQIRSQWAALSAAGLPSAERIRSATNRPHVTAMAATGISPQVDGELAAVAMHLPFPVTLGAVIIFGHGSHRVLARLVVPSSELLSVHATIVRMGAQHALDDTGVPTLFAHSRPGAWTPHVTLARRVRTDEIPAALEVLGTDPIEGSVQALRRWDGDTHAEHVIGAF
ncbi:2'-5' RNA ligase family protein [Gordonia sp. NPDC003376]